MHFPHYFKKVYRKNLLLSKKEDLFIILLMINTLTSYTTHVWDVTKSKTVSVTKDYIWPALQVIGSWLKYIAIVVYEGIKTFAKWSWNHIYTFAQTNPIGFKVTVITSGIFLLIGILLGRYLLPRSSK